MDFVAQTPTDESSMKTETQPRPEEAQRQQMSVPKNVCLYTCGQCGKTNKVRVDRDIGETPMCDHCGYRILFKQRSSKAYDCEAI